MMKIKIIAIACVLLVFTVQSCGQQGPGSIYLKLNEAYQDRDFQLLMTLYEDEAFYLSPGGRIQTNKAQFLAPVKELFDDAEAKGMILALNHRIIKRDYLEGAAIDIGYYKLDWLSQNGIESSKAGKFITVARKQSDGSWKFRAESYSDTPVEAFVGH